MHLYFIVGHLKLVEEHVLKKYINTFFLRSVSPNNAYIFKREMKIIIRNQKETWSGKLYLQYMYLKMSHI